MDYIGFCNKKWWPFTFNPLFQKISSRHSHSCCVFLYSLKWLTWVSTCPYQMHAEKIFSITQVQDRFLVLDGGLEVIYCPQTQRVKITFQWRYEHVKAILEYEWVGIGRAALPRNSIQSWELLSEILSSWDQECREYDPTYRHHVHGCCKCYGLRVCTQYILHKICLP